ncbi:hypothetical protein KJ590_00330 [Patescibacteria group bacterium]|nr:hypothetical protein [Patescibacteria group bacterium]
MGQQTNPTIQQEQPNLQPQKPLSKAWQIAAIIVVGILVVGGVSYGSYYLWQKSAKKVSQKACTMEAKLCSDGSSVGRTGPNCEFAACPSANLGPSIAADKMKDWQTYQDEQHRFEVKYPMDYKIFTSVTGGEVPLNVTGKVLESISTENIHRIFISWSGLDFNDNAKNLNDYKNNYNAYSTRKVIIKSQEEVGINGTIALKQFYAAGDEAASLKPNSEFKKNDVDEYGLLRDTYYEEDAIRYVFFDGVKSFIIISADNYPEKNFLDILDRVASTFKFIK